MSYERNHQSETGQIEVNLTNLATLQELIDARQFIQCEIDSRTPTLAETQQTGPVQVVESE